MYKAVRRKPRELKHSYKKARRKTIKEKKFEDFAVFIFLIILENFAKEGILRALEKGNSYFKRKEKRRGI
jgi:hypothetical protein